MRKTFDCEECGRGRCIAIYSYKRIWFLCDQCGSATSHDRSVYPLGLIPLKDFSRKQEINEFSIYDYFVSETHVLWSKKEAADFVANVLAPCHVSVAGLRLLDISGGNGEVAAHLGDLGAEVHLTEVNQPALDYARRTLGLRCSYFDLNKDQLYSNERSGFDLVLARACVMFARDLGRFAQQLASVIKPGGRVLLNHCVEPTLGVILRTQADQHSYFSLRQPERIVEVFEDSGFRVEWSSRETDSSLYVYDNDLTWSRRMLHGNYERKGIRSLKGFRHFAFPARDRRRSNLLFVKDI